jgi:putative membrane protein
VKFIVNLVISALSIGLAAHIVPGIHVENLMTLFIAAFLFGLLNAVVRPILVILTLPITILSLGLFLFIINAAIFALVAWILPGFSISSFGSAILGWLIVGLASWLVSAILLR